MPDLSGGRHGGRASRWPADRPRGVLFADQLSWRSAASARPSSLLWSGVPLITGHVQRGRPNCQRPQCGTPPLASRPLASSILKRRHPPERTRCPGALIKSATLRRCRVSSAGSGTAKSSARPEECLAYLLRRLALHCRGDVAVEVHEERGVGVPETLGGDLRRHAVREHERGARVTEPVRSEARQTELLGGAAEQPREVLGW